MASLKKIIIFTLFLFPSALMIFGEPLHYSIGEFDDRFGVTKKDVLESLAVAESVWEKYVGQNLFQYDPRAEFKINLRYGQQQRAAAMAQQLEIKMDDIAESRKDLYTIYKSRYAAYAQQKQIYEKKFREYQNESQKLNRTILYWNQRGHIPASVRRDIEKREGLVKKIETEAEKERHKLNLLVTELNKTVVKINQFVAGYNREVLTYRRLFGNERTFNQGDYRGDEINVYQFYGKSDLTLLLIHEMGHALGLEHVGNKRSIMYPLMGDQDLDYFTLTAEDKTELANAIRKKKNSKHFR